MDSGIDDLSEKEREALRLLLAGHDAKSSARELGISHHAINDRLRSARRKLGTSSSREAALALAETEGETPEPLVHKPLGDDRDYPTDDDGADASLKRRLSLRSPMRRKGIIVMMSIADDVSRADTHPVQSVTPTSAQSSAPALDFLTKLDAGDAKGTYAAAAPSLRESYNFDIWELGVLMNRMKGGAAQRTLTKVERIEKPANPDHERLEILTFDTARLDGERRIERIVMARTGGAWKVAKIDVDNPDAQ
ncbi:helix-turn-helix transcriptional regulator [Sphingomicrobium sp. XHP0235]|uniref:helix-turn-helix domain-containing protein n=1 Tax=Sphingomicrobium aquimarinum TaxID=3133971 RepID=UPI0031FE5898